MEPSNTTESADAATLHTRYDSVTPFITKDASTIRELLHPSSHPVKSMSFAEAIVNPGDTTRLHRHLAAEEIYHITSGNGIMRLGERTFRVGPGDTIAISPGTAHCITNSGNTPLSILCACHPAYADDDTDLL